MEGKALTERLAFTCRLLLDRRLLELKSENDRLKKFQQLSEKLTDEIERLELALFLEKHSSARLQILMGEVNMSASDNDQCNCLWFYDRSENVCVRGDCKFKPFFEEFFDEVVYDIRERGLDLRKMDSRSCCGPSFSQPTTRALNCRAMS